MSVNVCMLSGLGTLAVEAYKEDDSSMRLRGNNAPPPLTPPPQLPLPPPPPLPLPPPPPPFPPATPELTAGHVRQVSAAALMVL